MKSSFRPNSVFFLLAPFFMRFLTADLLIHKLFIRTLDCNGAPGCALDEPNGILEGMTGRLRCAVKCLARDCVNFNYLEASKSCLIFGTTPYKITNMTLCSSYDVRNLLLFLIVLIFFKSNKTMRTNTEQLKYQNC